MTLLADAQLIKFGVKVNFTYYSFLSIFSNKKEVLLRLFISR